MEPKERAIETLESLTHWLKTSRFDYDIEDLKFLLSIVVKDYKKYLDDK
tara:strand:- start:1491 stop:1637 length:147 start_codon:yes stop_codon:yes gene_type:complete